MSPASADGWIDANIILCHLTGEPPDMAQAVAGLLREAQSRGLKLRLYPVTVAEVVWVLTGAYGFSRQDVARVMRQFLRAECVVCEDHEVVVSALVDYGSLNVDYVDALLARKAALSRTPTCYTFDLRHFGRLGVDARDPRLS